MEQGPQNLNSLFTKSLTSLIESDIELLWSRKKLDYGKRDINEADLLPLFTGIYPIVFHEFASKYSFI